MSGVVHLAKRFVTSLSRVPPPAADLAWARSCLLASEWELWERFGAMDQRHTIEVARRFVASRPDASRPEVAAALLHDIGKLDSGLGVGGRVLATLSGPRTRRFRTYHENERIGAELCAAAGSDLFTVALVRGDATGAAADALRAADDI